MLSDCVPVGTVGDKQIGGRVLQEFCNTRKEHYLISSNSYIALTHITLSVRRPELTKRSRKGCCKMILL